METIKTKVRDYKYDNLKALLIFLVVFGHFLTPLSKTDIFARLIYVTFFSFHMPLFVYISGKFAKPSLKKIGRFLLLYLVFQVIYTPFMQHFYDPKIEWSITTPQWILWYLLALVFYYSLLFVLPENPTKKVKNIGILFSFTLAIVAGFIPFIGEPFSLSRTLVFLPFFLMGKWEKSNDIQVKTSKAKAMLCGGFALIMSLIIFFGSLGNRELVLQRKDYLTANTTWYWRLLVLITAVLFIKFFLRVIPQKRIPIITNIGQNTLIIFLFHGFAVKLYHYYVPKFTILDALFVSVITIAIISSILLAYKTIAEKLRATSENKTKC